MYRFILLLACLLFSFFSAFSQEGPDLLKDRYRMKVRAEQSSVINKMEQRQQGHRLKIGEREIPIQTPDGTIPAEKQLAAIKNVLTQDFLVNDDTTGGVTGQLESSISMDGSGNFVIVWQDYRNGNWDIYFQRYSSNGMVLGINTKANDDAGTAGQRYPSISMDGSGNFVIVWQDYRTGNGDIYFQRYNSDGTVLDINTKANDDAGTEGQYFPSISMDGSGNFVIVWQDYRNGNDDIYFQRYSSNGTALSVNTKANDDAGTALQWFPSISMDGSGNFVIVWQDYRNGNWDIYFQRYSSTGTELGVNTKADDDAGTAHQRYPSISMDGSGNFVIVWQDYRNGNDDIYFQRYSSTGTALGVNTKANDDADIAWQWFPSISMDGSGNFVIVWQDDRNGIVGDLYFQRFSSTGTALGVNTKADDNVGTADRLYPSIATDVSGNFVIAWQDERNGNDDIYFQRFSSNGTALGINTEANDDAWTALQWFPSISMDGSGNFVIVWQDDRNGNWDIYFQQYSSTGMALGVNTKANDDVGTAQQYFPSISMDGSGSFVVVWVDYRNGNSDIYIQRYNSSGATQGVNLKVNDDTGTAEKESPSIAIDGSGNFVIVWRDNRDVNYDLYCQRYNSSGTALGVNFKVNDYAGTAWQGYPSIAMDGSGNFVVVWEDDRNGISDIYFQRYNSTGTALGVNTKANDDAGTAGQSSSSISMDGSGSFVIVWQDARNDNSDIYFQRFSSTGTALGVNTKANDDTGTAGQSSSSISTDGSGNFVVVWEDYRYGSNNPDVIGQRFYADGSPSGTNYRIVADGPNYGEIFPVVVANSTQIVFSWMDNRRSKGWDIYGKIVSWDWEGVTSVLSEKNIPTEFALLQNYPNPFNPSTIFHFQLPIANFVTLKVFDVLGREVATLVNGVMQPGLYDIEWDAHDAPSGVYYYRLSTESFIETKKCVLLR